MRQALIASSTVIPVRSGLGVASSSALSCSADGAGSCCDVNDEGCTERGWTNDVESLDSTAVAASDVFGSGIGSAPFTWFAGAGAAPSTPVPQCGWVVAVSALEWPPHPRQPTEAHARTASNMPTACSRQGEIGARLSRLRPYCWRHESMDHLTPWGESKRESRAIDSKPAQKRRIPIRFIVRHTWQS